MSTVTRKNSHGTKRWLKCKLDQGMFSDEMAVTYPVTGSLQKSVFVSIDEVQGSPGELGKVRVVVVKRGGKTLAVLPSSRQDLVFVSVGDVTDE